MRTFAIVAALAATLQACHGLAFDLKASATRCVSEVVGQDILALGKYEVVGVSGGAPSGVDVTLTSPANEYEYQAQGRGQGKFAFTAKTEGVHKLCFVNTDGQPKRISIEYKVGVDARDYSEVAKKEHLKPLELELRKLEDKAEEIHREMSYQRAREEKMRDTNESTNTRVLWFTVLSIVVLSGLGAWQIIYLRTFFKQRQLI